MSENELPEVPATALGPIRPLSVRITDDLRAQIEVIAQLNDRSVTEEIRLALESWVETSNSDPKVLQRTVGAGRDRARGQDQAERDRGHLRGRSAAWRPHYQAVFGLTRTGRPRSSTASALPGVSALQPPVLVAASRLVR
ncbi:hypothetical protein AAEP80_09630 [Curtobacterium sp. L3-7]|uniref:hypothetical protein n=1 Tax=Curtobacterium sp. L3-7 TaxID=3138787 RepID=UPI003B524E57